MDKTQIYKLLESEIDTTNFGKRVVSIGQFLTEITMVMMKL